MRSLRDVLVTDRTSSDMLARNEKGTYNAEDLNRVLRAVSWLAGKLEGYGYTVPAECFPAALVSVRAEPPGGGTVKSALYYKGERAVLKAEPADGFEFQRWAEAGEMVSSDLEYSFLVERDRELVAVFGVRGDLDYGVIGLGRVGAARVGRKGD